MHKRALAVLNTLTKNHEAYFVGGAVRDRLLGVPYDDVDIATSATPHEVIAAFTGSGMALYPTGLAHGTLTVVHKGASFEVTTYRRDVETDGRHATVEYGDIHDDAYRRDLTINALYMDAHGDVVDPTGQGLSDLFDGRVRFVGDAETRCREDYLRILRFFRFHQRYGLGPVDVDAAVAIRKKVSGLQNISRERVMMEYRKLLGLPGGADTLERMDDLGVLQNSLNGATHPDRVRTVCINAQRLGIDVDWRTKMHVLAPKASGGLPLSKEDRRFFAQLERPIEVSVRIDAFLSPDAHAARQRLLLRAYRTDESDLEELQAGVDAVMPVTAQDIMADRIISGPDVGSKLRKAQDLFIKSGLTAPKSEILGGIFPA